MITYEIIPRAVFEVVRFEKSETAAATESLGSFADNAKAAQFVQAIRTREAAREYLDVMAAPRRDGEMARDTFAALKSSFDPAPK